MSLITREQKGSALTWEEMDANLEYLETVPAAPETLELYKETVTIEPTVATAASYTGTPTGCSTEVTITADNAGTAGNVTLKGDGVNTINDIIASYNSGNPSNTVSLTTGDGAQVPADEVRVLLDGGKDTGGNPTTVTITHNLDATMVRVSVHHIDAASKIFFWYLNQTTNDTTTQDNNGIIKFKNAEALDNSIIISIPTGFTANLDYTFIIEKLF